MISLIDKLCDHLSNEKVKVLIDNGFDEWETITLMRGEQLIEMAFSSEQCIIIMVAVNANSAEFGHEPVFSEETMKTVLQKAAQKHKQTLQNI